MKRLHKPSAAHTKQARPRTFKTQRALLKNQKTIDEIKDMK